MSDEPYKFTPEQEAWLRDLETTEEPQVPDVLHRFEFVGENDEVTPGGYCCLGRACVVLGIDEIRAGDYGLFGKDREQAVLPRELVQDLHLLGDEGQFDHPGGVGGRTYKSLAEMNDDGVSFKQIAAYIRSNPWNVFKDPDTEEPEQ